MYRKILCLIVSTISKKQGVIIFAPNNKQYKILNKDYLKFFSVRGNEPSIKYRYLQVRMNSHLINIFLDLYPNMIEKFEDYENVIYSIAQNIYKSYDSGAAVKPASQKSALDGLDIRPILTKDLNLPISKDFSKQRRLS